MSLIPALFKGQLYLCCWSPLWLIYKSQISYFTQTEYSRMGFVQLSVIFLLSSCDELCDLGQVTLTLTVCSGYNHVDFI